MRFWQTCQRWTVPEQPGIWLTGLPLVDRVKTCQKDQEEGQQLLWKTRTESARLAAQLTGLVQARILCRSRTGKRGKKLDGRRLHRMAVGDARLFCRRAESITMDATVHLCLDCPHEATVLPEGGDCFAQL